MNFAPWDSNITEEITEESRCDMKQVNTKLTNGFYKQGWRLKVVTVSNFDTLIHFSTRTYHADLIML